MAGFPAALLRQMLVKLAEVHPNISTGPQHPLYLALPRQRQCPANPDLFKHSGSKILQTVCPNRSISVSEFFCFRFCEAGPLRWMSRPTARGRCQFGTSVQDSGLRRLLFLCALNAHCIHNFIHSASYIYNV